MLSSGVLLILLIALGVYSQWQHKKLTKAIKFEEYKNRELKKKIKMALKTISKMERNPDLIHSREFNLDYLRMRMEEELFHFAIVNQLKVKVKQELSAALRARPEGSGIVGIASKPRQVNQIFDVKYRPHDRPDAPERILFRIQIQLAKIPTQATSTTIAQIIECIENFLSPNEEKILGSPQFRAALPKCTGIKRPSPPPY
jgi:hypothetical protein